MSIAEDLAPRALRSARTRAVLIALAVAATAAAVAGILMLVGSPGSTAPAPRRQVATLPVVTLPAPTTTTSTVPPLAVPASTELATPNGTIPTYSAPGSAPLGTVGSWYGYPLTLPVIAQQGTWLEVRLPQRPNGSTAWVSSSNVTLGSTPYRIVVRLTQQDLIVYRAGLRFLAFPVGLGVPATPTPTGNYFVAVRETNLPPQSYGPIVLDTSAHSDAIESWEGAGDAIIAIHGPITAGADAEIGAAGARVSNGCIRLHLSDLAQLEMIPVGTPVDITA